MRVKALFLCASLAGCASSKTAKVETEATRPPMETIQFSTSQGSRMAVSMIHEDRWNGGALPVALEPVWLAIRVVYDSLGVPVTTLEQQTHTIGNSSFKIRRRLGGVALSRYIDCGSMQGTPSADSYEVIMSLVSTVQRRNDSTVVMTRVDGQARPQSVSGDWVRCSTTGALEQRIVQSVAAIAWVR